MEEPKKYWMLIHENAEGSWDEVMKAIGKAHAIVHQRGVARVQSTITVGTR